MSLKKMAALFVVLTLMLCTLPLAAAAIQTGEEVRAMVEALPALEALQAMSMEEQQQVYTQTQAAYDAYQTLSDLKSPGQRRPSKLCSGISTPRLCLWRKLLPRKSLRKRKRESSGVSLP